MCKQLIFVRNLLSKQKEDKLCVIKVSAAIHFFQFWLIWNFERTTKQTNEQQKQ